MNSSKFIWSTTVSTSKLVCGHFRSFLMSAWMLIYWRENYTSYFTKTKLTTCWNWSCPFRPPLLPLVPVAPLTFGSQKSSLGPLLRPRGVRSVLPLCLKCDFFYLCFQYVGYEINYLFWSFTGAGVNDFGPSSNWKARSKARSKKMT